MQIGLQALSQEELVKPNTALNNESGRVQLQVEKVRHIQLSRQNCLNANLSAKECEAVCELGQEEQSFLMLALQRLKLSARAYHRLLKVARTIADTKEEGRVNLQALQLALSFKQTLQAPK